ncbi:MAG: dTMP kinase [Candidatus Delongbacteria bacterium]|nr:dTMP kinase [Candidatus Delongbacteria bacterium]
MNPARFITFEGIDRCGKTSQVKLLREYCLLHDIPAVVSREPGGAPVSEKIRHILLDKANSMVPMTELLLYTASRKQHLEECIRPNLTDGRHVICDRYLDSSLVYQGVVRGIDRQTILDIHRLAGIDIMPDITFLIDLPIEICEARIQASGDRNRMEHFSIRQVEQMRQGYLALAVSYPERYVVVDGNRSIQEIHHQIIVNFSTLQP